MEDTKTLTGVDKSRVKKHLETLSRRLSYLEERFLLKNNSFDGAECGALKHCIWLLQLELTDAIVLTDEKTGRTTNSGSTSASETKPTSIILRRKTT